VFNRPTGFGITNNPVSYAELSSEIDFPTHNQKLLNGGWSRQPEVDIEMQLGTGDCQAAAANIWGFDSCYGVGQRSYNLQPQQTSKGRVIYAATTPFAASESFEVAADG